MYKIPDMPRRSEGNRVIGVYCVFHYKTLKSYIGSGRLYFRKHRHFSDLEKGIHDNWKLQEAYNDDKRIEFIPIKIYKTEDEALDHEQLILDQWYDSGLLFNIARDARKSGIGRLVTQEEKENLRNLKLGIPRQEYVKEKLRAARQIQLTTPEAIERMRVGNLKRSNQVMLDGVVYDSLRHASRSLNIDKSTIVDRIKHPTKYLEWKYI